MTDPVSTSGPIITSPIVMGGAPPAVDSPIVEGNPPAPVAEVVAPVADPAIVDPTPAPDPAAPVTPPAENVPEGVQKRINEITAKRFAAEREAQTAINRAAALEATNKELLARIENKAGTPAATDPSAPKPIVTEEEIERRATEKAQLMAQANEFNKACNAIVEVGKKDFTDWDAAVHNLDMVGAIGKDASPAFLETAIELKNPAKILHYLGTNVDQAEKIAKLNPTRMAMELVRVEALVNAPSAPAPLPAPTPVSNAPAPVITVGGAAKPGAIDLSDPNITMEQYNELRNKQAEERRKRYTRA